MFGCMCTGDLFDNVVYSLSEHLRRAALHMQKYLNCDTAAVVSGCTYADLWSLIARVNSLDSFHLEQLDGSGTSPPSSHSPSVPTALGKSVCNLVVNNLT